MRNKLILLCLLVSAPVFAQANETEVPIETLHVVKQNLDEATLTEDGMYEVSTPKDHLVMLATGVAVGAATTAGLTSLRNWQEYLLDMSDGKTLEKK